MWAKSALVNIYADGSIVVATPGAEIGQGLLTKTAQAVSYQLGLLFADGENPKGRPVDMGKIKFAPLDTSITPNGAFTGGSTGSEGCAVAAMRACDQLVGRLKGALVSRRALLCLLERRSVNSRAHLAHVLCFHFCRPV